jgi:HK97 family phage portal protein
VNYLREFLGGPRVDLERKSLQDIDRAFAALVEQAATKAGVRVTVNSVFGIAAAFACLRVLSEGFAQVPLKLYRETEKGTKEVAKKHPLHRLLSRRPNDWQTSFEWRETMMLHARLTKGSFNYISRTSEPDPRDRRILELIPLVPDQVKPIRDDQNVVKYELSDSKGPVRVVPRETLMCFRGPSWDGVQGLEVVRVCREILGLSLAVDAAVSRLQANATRPSGVLSTDAVLDEEALGRIKRNIQVNNEGAENTGRLMILDLGFKYFQTAMTGVDAQTLEHRKVQTEDIARIFGVYPQMIGHADKTSTHASAEQFSRDHVIYTLRPWYERFQQVVARDLLTEEELDAGYFAKLHPEGLMAGDSKARAEFYASGIVNGWLTRNEARVYEDKDPLPGLDDPLVPLNMGTQSQRDALLKGIGKLDQKALARALAEQLGVPALEAKIGRVLSARNEGKLQQARDLLDEVLAQVAVDQDGKAAA